jgi:NAD(P)-dependent dehydrogenase (short-subunit alcohol dehydrogenase family)
MFEAQADVGKPDEVRRAFELIRTRLGEPEVRIFNAAAGPFGNVNEVTSEQFEKLHAR